LESNAPKPEVEEAFRNQKLPDTKLMDAKHEPKHAVPRTDARLSIASADDEARDMNDRKARCRIANS